MQFTNLEFCVIVFLILIIGFIAIISSYGWLVEYTRRKQYEQKRKDFFEIEMALLNSTSIYGKDYTEYFLQLQKQIKKERQNKDVYL